MLTTHEYPIMEFDDNKNAKLNPSLVTGERLSCNKLIITFFPEVIEKLKADGRIVPEVMIRGENSIQMYRFVDADVMIVLGYVDADVMIVLGYVGCPACGGNLDLFNAMGVEKVMFCGGGGVLDKNIEVGQILLVDGAIRDEGFSFHYVKPARYIYTDKAVTDKIAKELDGRGVSYLRGIVWTTDAIFRETADRIERRRAEGAKIVEMEQAGCIAVAQFRGFDYGALIYGGDDVSQDEWDNRSWRSREGIRHDLVMLCKELVQRI